MKRRDFLKLSTGILIACRADLSWALQGRGQRPGFNYPTDFNLYFYVGRDDRVACYVGKIEMGQGNMTSLAQLAAEELCAPLDSIDMVMGDTDLCPWDLGTFGSMSIAVFGPVLRRAAAEAREVLRELASERLKRPVESLIAADGFIRDRERPELAISYGEIADGRRIDRHREAPSLKTGAGLSVIGRSVPRRDGVDKVTGRAVYAGDIRLPGMLYAKLVRPPAHGAVLTRVDTAGAAAVAGASVVRDGDLVAVLHEQPDAATRACALITAEWDRRAAPLDAATIFQHLVDTAPPGETLTSTGDVHDATRSARFVVDETYRNAYVAHAPMETHAALAVVRDGAAKVWVSTQAPFMVKPQIAAALGVPADRVRVITPFVGGGFGGKVPAQQAVEAARLAKLTGKPVQVMWDRREEFFFDTFRPAAVMKVRSAVDGAGKIVAWDGEVFGAGDGGAVPFYDIASQHVVSHGGWQSSPPGWHPFGVGAWRAPAVNSNTFAREVQVDLMAARAGVDPLQFRLANLADPRMRRVLEAAAQQFGWTAAPAPSGRGVGVACSMYGSTYVATMAAVRVDLPTGRVRVNRVVCAQDMGEVVNPEGARMQMEGCITMGLGYALGEDIRFKDGAILDRNFDTYAIPRFSWLPAIETILIEAPDRPASAGGEPAIVCMGAVIANAIHDATGATLHDLPMSPARVKDALNT